MRRHASARARAASTAPWTSRPSLRAIGSGSPRRGDTCSGSSRRRASCSTGREATRACRGFEPA
eukprot:13255964-Alexandrium_andersonii.AAC.1